MPLTPTTQFQFRGMLCFQLSVFVPLFANTFWLVSLHTFFWIAFYTIRCKGFHSWNIHPAFYWKTCSSYFGFVFRTYNRWTLHGVKSNRLLNTIYGNAYLLVGKGNTKKHLLSECRKLKKGIIQYWPFV